MHTEFISECKAGVGDLLSLIIDLELPDNPLKCGIGFWPFVRLNSLPLDFTINVITSFAVNVILSDLHQDFQITEVFLLSLSFHTQCSISV